MDIEGKKKWYKVINFTSIWLLIMIALNLIPVAYRNFIISPLSFVTELLVLISILIYMYFLRRKYGSNNSLWKDKKFLILFSIMIFLAIGRAILFRLV